LPKIQAAAIVELDANVPQKLALPDGFARHISLAP
jgi:hypothetical protein